MTPEKQRFTIASVCGWHEKPEPHGSFNATAWWQNEHRYPSYEMPVPDYLNDLNAMHEAERVLTESQQSEFADKLNRIHAVADLTYPEPNMRGFRKDLFSEAFHLIHATAAQRAEAFLRTLNLWES